MTPEVLRARAAELRRLAEELEAAASAGNLGGGGTGKYAFEHAKLAAAEAEGLDVAVVYLDPDPQEGNQEQ